MSIPIRNPAMVVELGLEACESLMTRSDWRYMIDLFVDQCERAERAGLVRPVLPS